MTFVPSSRMVMIGHRRLRIVTWGDPSHRPVVLVHGMRDQARSWDRVSAALAQDYFVIAPDLRGHGDSDWVDADGYGIAAFVIDLADVIDALELHRIALVGHSLGGAIALRYAGAFPDRVSALCGIECIELPIVRDQRERPSNFPLRMARWIADERARRTRKSRAYRTIAAAEERMREAHPTLDADTIADLVEHGVVRDGDGGWRWKYDNAARLRAPDDADGRDLDEVLTAISCPTLLCYGTASWIALPPPERLALLAGHRTAIFRGAGHWLHHEARDDFVAAVADLLSSTVEGPRHA